MARLETGRVAVDGSEFLLKAQDRALKRAHKSSVASLHKNYFHK